MRATSDEVQRLAERCAQETRQFYAGKPNDSTPCYELWRQACVYDSPDALLMIGRQYEPIAMRWAERIQGLASTGETAHYFATNAIRKTIKRLRGDQFEQFPSLAQILKFIKICLSREVLRGVPPNQPVILNDEIADQNNAHADLNAQILWDYICTLLPNNKDQLLAKATFMWDLKPRHIIQLFPDEWPDQDAVRVDLQRIRRRLRDDDTLQNWMKGGEK